MTSFKALRAGYAISLMATVAGIALCVSPCSAKEPARPSETLTLVDLDGTQIAFKYDDLRQFPQVTEEDCICVGETSGFIGIYDYRGLRLSEILKKAKAANGASGLVKENLYVVFRGTDGYQVLASWSELHQPPNGPAAMLILEKEGEVLPPNEGFVRLALLGDKYVGRSVKCLERIEIRCAEGVPEQKKESPEEKLLKEVPKNLENNP